MRLSPSIVARVAALLCLYAGATFYHASTVWVGLSSGTTFLLILVGSFPLVFGLLRSIEHQLEQENEEVLAE